MILELFSNGVATANIDNLVKKINTLTLAEGAERLSVMGVAEAEAKAALIRQGYEKETVEATMANYSYKTSTDAVNNSMRKSTWQAMTKAVAAFKTAMTEASLAGVGGYIQLASASKSFFTTLLAGLPTIVKLGSIVAIGYGIYKIFDICTTSAKEANEAVEKLVSTFEEAKNTLDSHKSTIDSISDRYEELSKGVSNLGKNVSLTTDEYSEYQNICNQIADMYPTLVQGYDEQSNAILKLKGNVDELKKAYEEEQQAAYNTLIATGEDNNGDSIVTAYKQLSDPSLFDKLKDLGNANAGGAISVKDAKEVLNKVLSVGYKERMSGFEDIQNVNYNAFSYLQGLGINPGEIVNSTEEEFNNLRATLRAELQTLEAETTVKLKNMHLLANAYLMTNEDYSKLDEEVKNVASVIVNNFDESIAEGFENQIDVGEYVVKIVTMISEHPELKDSLVGLFDLDYSDMPIDQAEAVIELYLNELAQVFDNDTINTIREVLSLNNILGLNGRLDNSIRTISDERGIVNREDYEMLEEYTKDFNESETNTWLEVTKGINSAEEAIRAYERAQKNIIESSTFTGFTEEQSKSIDDFQSKAKTLGDTLTSLAKGEDINLTDLIQEFPELAGETDNLDEAIRNLIKSNLEKLFELLGEDLPDNVKNDLIDFSNELTGLEPKLSTAFSDIQKSYDVIKDLKKEIESGKFTDSTLSSVAGINETMNTLVAGFYAGAVSIEEITEALNAQYQIDLENYGKALIAKNEYSEDFYNSVGLADTEFINTFYEHYKIDLENCKKYAEAKKQIELSTLNLVAGNWQRYYNIQTDTLTMEYDKLMEGARNGDAYANQILEQINKYREAIAELNNVAFNGIETSFDGISSSLDNNGNSGANKQSTETIDYIQIALSRIQREIQNIDKVASDASASSKKRMQAYNDEIEAINKELELQGQAYDYYLNKANSVDLSEDIKAKIRNGSISIEDYDSEIAKKIKEYQEFWEQALDRMDAADELQRRINELLIAKIELQINELTSEYEKFNRKLDMLKGIISLKEKFGFNVTEGDYNRQNNSLISQIANLNKQNELIKQQQALVDADSEKWREYQQTIDNNRQSIEDLTQAMEDNALAMANLANESAGNRASKLDKLDELYNARIGNRSNPNSQNSLLNRILGNIDKRQNAYNNAVDKNRTSVETNASNIANARNKDNAAIIAKVKQYTKAKKKIPASILQEAKKLNDNGQLYNMLVKYNASVIAYETSQETANLYNETAQQERANLAAQKMNNIQQYYQNRQNNIKQRQTRINSAIAQVEAQGYIVSKTYYQKLIQQEKANNASLVKERDKLVQSLNTSVANGDIKEGSKEWYELCQQIDEVTNAIDESDLALIEYQNTMRELDWSNFDRLQDRFTNLRSEIDFVISEMSRKDLTDKDEGWLTDNGKAVIALRGADYKMLISQAKDYEEKLTKINKQIAEDPYNQDLIDRQTELRSTYQSLITASQDQLDAVKDLYQQGYDALLDRLSEVISEYEKLLDAEKDAYDYQQRIEDATKNIANLRKQLTAYANDLSEETRMKVQNITVELQQAEKDLQNTQYDKMMSLTKEMFSNLQDSMAEAVQDIIDNLDPQKIIEAMSQDGKVFGTITNAMKGIGYMSSTEFTNILSGEKGIFTNTESVMSQIEKDWNTMIANIDKIANGTKPSTTADGDNNNNNSNNNGNNNNNSNNNNNGNTDSNGNKIPVYVPVTDANGNTYYVPVDDNHQPPDKTVDAEGNQAYGVPMEGTGETNNYGKNLQPIEMNLDTVALSKMLDNSFSQILKPIDINSLVSSISKNADRDVNIEIGDIILPDVTDGKEFAESLKNTLKNDTSVQKMFKDFTVTSLTGGNSMSIRKY